MAERAERARHATQHPKSPSDFSCQSYDNMFAGQDRGGIGDEHNHREKMSLRSASITSQDKHSDTTSMDRQSGKTRKVCDSGDDDVRRARNGSMTIIVVSGTGRRREPWGSSVGDPKNRRCRILGKNAFTIRDEINKRIKFNIKR